MTGPEIHALRRTFEQHAREQFRWRAFERNLSGDYTNAQVAQAWYWLRMGFAAAAGVQPCAHSWSTCNSGVYVCDKCGDQKMPGETR